MAQCLGGPRGRLDEREVGSLLTLVEFGLTLAAILVAASLFTNAVEILGARLGLQQGGVGSVLAAVGTALPETIIPIVTILESVFTGKEPGRAAEIGTGAILGLRSCWSRWLCS